MGSRNIDQEKFDKLKKDREGFYKTIKEVHCPYFKEKVAFNAKGLDHIKFKEWDKARLIREQYARFKLLKFAPEIIKNSHTLQEFHETKRLERQKINSRWERRALIVRYYGFVAIIRRFRLKIIIKEVEGGKKFFWSIIPFWKAKKNFINSQYKKILHEGDLEVQ